MTLLGLAGAAIAMQVCVQFPEGNKYITLHCGPVTNRLCGLNNCGDFSVAPMFESKKGSLVNFTEQNKFLYRVKLSIRGAPFTVS